MSLLASKKKRTNVAGLQARGDVDGLAAILRDPAAKDRMLAAGALAAIGGPHAITALLRAVAEPDPDVRSLGLLGLGALKGTADLPMLIDTVTNVSLPAELREMVSQSIGFLDYPQNPHSAELRVGLIRALADKSGPEAEAILTAWLDSVVKRGMPYETQLRTELQAAHGKAGTPAPVTADRIAAVAIACDAFIAFDSDEALNGFATRIVQSKWPGLTLAANTRVEGAMGFSGSEDEADRELDKLLTVATEAAAVDRADCEISYFTADSEVPPTKVWCKVAVKRQGSQS